MVTLIETCRIGEIMTQNPLTVRPDTTIVQVGRIFEMHACNMFPVISDRGVLQGVVTKLDLLKISRSWSGRITADLRALWSEEVEDIMSRGVISVTQEEPVATALTLMVSRRFRSIPVVQRKTREAVLVGIISRNDVLKCLVLDDSENPVLR
jgi:acetoin utilization protein AcuB